MDFIEYYNIGKRDRESEKVYSEANKVFKIYKMQ